MKYDIMNFYIFFFFSSEKIEITLMVWEFSGEGLRLVEVLASYFL